MFSAARSKVFFSSPSACLLFFVFLYLLIKSCHFTTPKRDYQFLNCMVLTEGNMVHSQTLITAEAIIMVGPFLSSYDTNIPDVINITKGSNTTTEDVRFAKYSK